MSPLALVADQPRASDSLTLVLDLAQDPELVALRQAWAVTEECPLALAVDPPLVSDSLTEALDWAPLQAPALTVVLVRRWEPSLAEPLAQLGSREPSVEGLQVRLERRTRSTRGRLLLVR